jgi:hypothetical protein
MKRHYLEHAEQPGEPYELTATNSSGPQVDWFMNTTENSRQFTNDHEGISVN